MVASLLTVSFYLLAAVSHVSAVFNTHYCLAIKKVGLVTTCHAPPNISFDGRAASASLTAPATSSTLDSSILPNIFKALADLQNDYFNKTQNTWPGAIDWTAAVVQTIVSGTMSTLTQSLHVAAPDHDWKQKENLLSFLHEQITSYYFGQQADRILDEAYDDVLWVVLGWIEAIKFQRLHQDLHYPDREFNDESIPTDIRQALETMPWHGRFWVDAFAQRANKFWEFSTRGWDTKLCHGGMTWNPRLETYKNAITNELYIAGSISMYLHYPVNGLRMMGSHDKRHLQAARDGYDWLSHVNMTNKQGLFVDGFHISRKIRGNVECDQRDEMVYTYNQGVILTGNRGLYSATGNSSYVQDGHKHIQSAIAATGWSLQDGMPIDSLARGKLAPWRGLGRYGIMEEQCDASATCSQDSQTFKGIYFHHLTAFCRPLELFHVDDNAKEQALQVQQVHASSCCSYVDWIKHNADAALQTRDRSGHFGMWWGSNVYNVKPRRSNDDINHFSANKTDYRNEGTPQDERWGIQDVFVPGGGNATAETRWSDMNETWRDPNSRGRGRTVETQVGGLALLRAYWEICRSFE